MRRLLKFFNCIRRHAVMSLLTDGIVDFFAKAFKRQWNNAKAK